MKKEKVKVPTTEEYIKSRYHVDNLDDVALGGTSMSKMMVDYTKLHVQEALKQSSKKAKISFRKLSVDNTGGYIEVPTIYKRSILNSYPLENII